MREPSENIRQSLNLFDFRAGPLVRILYPSQAGGSGKQYRSRIYMEGSFLSYLNQKMGWKIKINRDLKETFHLPFVNIVINNFF